MNTLHPKITSVSLKKLMAFFVIYGSILGLSPYISAQELSLYFNHYTNENGLAQNSTRSIVQDSTGFIWIATEDGLNRFDGYEFICFREDSKKKNSLSSDYITDLCVDYENRLWIATWGGLNCYKQETETFYSYTHQQDKPLSIISNTVRVVFIDSENHLWVGSDKGVNRSRTTLDKVNLCNNLNFFLFSAGTKQNQLVDNFIKSITEDEHKNIWIGSSLGLNRIDKKTGNITKYPLPNTAGGNRINNIVADHKGNLWLATDKGLFRFDISESVFFSYANEPFFKENKERNQVLSLLYDKEGGLYIGTKNIGLIYYKIDKNSYSHFYKESDKPYSLQNRQVFGLMIDKSNSIFVIGLNGLDIAEIKNKPFGLNKCIRTKNNNLLSPNVLSVYCPDKTHLWLGFEQQGLALYNRKTKKFKNYLFEKLNNGGQLSIRTIYPVDKNKLLIGCRENGLLLFNTQIGQYKRYKNGYGISSNNIFFIAKNKKGKYWIATQGGGLYKFDIEKGTFKNYLPDDEDKNSLGYSIIPHILIDSKGKQWIATFGGGLHLYNEETDDFTRYTHSADNKNSISSDKVTYIFEDSEGILWVGTATGLNKFDPSNGSFVRYAKKDGLTNEFIYAIQEDNKSNLWMSTNFGLFKFNKTTKKFTNYDVKSGLQNNEFNINAACKTNDSLLFFSGVSGFNLFNPDNIKNSNFVPDIAITSFQMFYEDVKIGKEYNNLVILNKSINNSDTIYLNYKNNQFSFEFTSFDYTKPTAIKYSVRLKGFNDLWHEVAATKRYVSYTNLNPGTYTLQIKASNTDGVWNSNIKNLTIIIKPPFWLRWWFIISVILSFVLLAYFIFHLRTIYLIKQKNVLEAQVKERTKTIGQKNNLLTNQKEELKLQAEELRSITDQLKDLNISLEKQIENRTIDLNSALEKAEDAQKLISSFLANMSHELRTPMNAISGFSQLIANTQTNDTEKQKYSDIINTNIDTLLALIDNIMDVAKLHTNQYKFINNTFYLPDLCNRIYNELNSNTTLKKKDVNFIYSSANIPCINIHSDPKAFRHIIFNIL